MQLRELKTPSGTIVYWVSYAPDASMPADSAALFHECDVPKYTSSKNHTPWLVFLPGLTADHRLFEQQLTHFRNRAHCLVWDPPAHGKSRPFALDFSLKDLAHYLHDILLREHIEAPILIGQSMGGYVSQCFIHEFPQTARGFVSIDSAPLQRSYYSSWEITALRHTKGMYESIPWNLLKKMGARGCATTAYGQSLMRQMMDSYSKKEYCALAGHGYRILADAIDANLFYNLDCPTLLIWGEKDQAAMAKRYNQKWTLKTGLSFVEIPDAGHNSNTDAPAEVNRHIDIFIDGLC